MTEPAMFKALVRFLWIPALLMVLLAFMPRPAHAGFDAQHTAFNALLAKHVVRVNAGNASQVRYKGFAQDHAALKGYLDSVSEGLGNPIQSPWKKKFFPLFGEATSLDDIEQNRLRQRGAYDDLRILFALNCGSIGCPKLRAQAARVAFLDDDWRLNDARP